MDEAVKGNPQPPEFLSTYPGYGTRIRNLQQWLPDAMVYYNSSSKAPNNPIIN